MKPNQAEPELCHNFQNQVHFENNSDGSNNVCSLNVRTSKAKILKQVEYESARRNKYVKKQEKAKNKSLHSLLSHKFLSECHEICYFK